MAVRVKYLGKLIVIALLLALVSEYGKRIFISAAVASEVTRTRPAVEVFEVKEKDLPMPAVSAPRIDDIPIPDFKEAEDAASLSAQAPPANIPSKIKSGEIISGADSSAASSINNNQNTISSQPVEEEKYTKQSLPRPDAKLVAEEPKELPVASSNEITEQEKATYEELRSHLRNFIATGVAQKTQLPEAAVSPLAIVAPKTDDLLASNAGIEKSPALSQEIAKAQESPQIVANTPVDAFDDFVAPGKEKQDTNKEKPTTPEVKASPQKPDIQPNVAAGLLPPVLPAPAPAKNQAVASAANNPVADAAVANVAVPTPPLANINSDKITQLPPLQPKEVNIDESASGEQQTRLPLNEADKAYLKLLDQKRKDLPEEKKLSEVSRSAINGAALELTPLVPTRKREPSHLNIERGRTGNPSIDENGVRKGQNNIDIAVRRIGKNEDVEKTKVKLEKAYKALIVGQISAAISIYKNILDKEPRNKEALFGLATAYHKNSQLDQARDIYVNLLKSEPGNKEALNNFLVMVAEEAPEDALIELEKLERINSDFSPIPAQIGMINLKLGNNEKAARSLRRAVILSPDNITYQYNLAITYDKMARSEDAIKLYKKVAGALQRGEVIPGSADKMLERMMYLEKKIAEKK